MKPSATILLHLLIMATALRSVQPECPVVEDMPLRAPNIYHAFRCAQIYTQKQTLNENEIVQCKDWDPDHKGGYFLLDGDNLSSDDPNDFIPVASLVVMPGCTFYGFDESNFEGDFWEVPGGDEGKIVMRVNNSHHTKACDNSPDGWFPACGFKSIKCRCIHKLPICKPTEEYEIIMQCDNTDGYSEVLCEYTHRVGTIYSAEATHGFNVSTRVKAEVGLSLSSIFSATVSTERSTGYNWRQTTKDFRETVEESKVTTSVPPGTLLVIEQAIGMCRGNSVRTEFLRISHIKPNGSLKETVRAHRMREAPIAKSEPDQCN